MSWDVTLMKLPDNFDGNWENLPEDFEPKIMCTQEYLQKEIKKLFPNINNDDPTWMILDEETFSIEFNVGNNDPINSIMLHVRGEQEALKAIKIFSEKFNCSAIEIDGGRIIDFTAEINEGFSEWQKYRDQIVNE